MIQLVSSTELVFRVLVSRRHVVPGDSTTLAYRVECYHSTHSLLYRVVILLEEKLRASATLHLSGTVFFFFLMESHQTIKGGHELTLK